MKRTVKKSKTAAVKKTVAKPKSPVRAGLWHSPDRPCGKTPGHDGVTTDPAKVNCAACLKLRASNFDSRTGREECPHGTAIWVRCEKCADERVEPPTDFRKLALDEPTAWGPIAKCPCGQMGARHELRLWKGVTRYAHTLERVAGVADIQVIGNKFIDDGTTGRLRPALVHYVDSTGALIERIERPRTRPELAIAHSEGEDSKGSDSLRSEQSGQKARRVVASESRERSRAQFSRKGTVNTSDFKCLNHKTCGSKTRKHARGLCYNCYRATRKLAA